MLTASHIRKRAGLVFRNAVATLRSLCKCSSPPPMRCALLCRAQQPFSIPEQQPGIFWDTKWREKNPLHWVGVTGRAEPASISPMLSVKQVPYHYSINPCDLLVPAHWMYAQSIQGWFTDILPGLNNCKAHQHCMKNAICKKPFSSAEMVVSGSISLSANFQWKHFICIWY